MEKRLPLKVSTRRKERTRRHSRKKLTLKNAQLLSSPIVNQYNPQHRCARESEVESAESSSPSHRTFLPIDTDSSNHRAESTPDLNSEPGTQELDNTEQSNPQHRCAHESEVERAESGSPGHRMFLPINIDSSYHRAESTSDLYSESSTEEMSDVTYTCNSRNINIFENLTQTTYNKIVDGPLHRMGIHFSGLPFVTIFNGNCSHVTFLMRKIHTFRVLICDDALRVSVTNGHKDIPDRPSPIANGNNDLEATRTDERITVDERRDESMPCELITVPSTISNFAYPLSYCIYMPSALVEITIKFRPKPWIHIKCQSGLVRKFNCLKTYEPTLYNKAGELEVVITNTKHFVPGELPPPISPNTLRRLIPSADAFVSD